MMNKFNLRLLLLLTVGSVVIFSSACKDLLPVDREEVGSDSRFTQHVYEPILGRTTVFGDNFYKGSTSYPADFKIVNPRRFNGDPAPELKDTFPVLVWDEDALAYTGDESSLAEIQAKRDTEYHAAWEIRPHSGQFVMWASANSSFINVQPDSGYIFDVELKNSGGRRYFRNLKLRPLKAQPYEPNPVDKVLGQGTRTGIHPVSVVNVAGAHYDRNISAGDIDIFFHRDGDGHSLRFMFLDTLYHPINPNKFFNTKWGSLIHGFDRKMTDSSVTYQVAYPIPLTERKTKYTTQDGKMAHVEFWYSRIGFGHIRLNSMIAFNFKIYQPGDWTITLVFNRDNPKFKDE